MLVAFFLVRSVALTRSSTTTQSSVAEISSGGTKLRGGFVGGGVGTFENQKMLELKLEDSHDAVVAMAKHLSGHHGKHKHDKVSDCWL